MTNKHWPDTKLITSWVTTLMVISCRSKGVSQETLHWHLCNKIYIYIFSQILSIRELTLRLLRSENQRLLEVLPPWLTILNKLNIRHYCVFFGKCFFEWIINLWVGYTRSWLFPTRICPLQYFFFLSYEKPLNPYLSPVHIKHFPSHLLMSLNLFLSDLFTSSQYNALRFNLMSFLPTPQISKGSFPEELLHI